MVKSSAPAGLFFNPTTGKIPWEKNGAKAKKSTTMGKN
jgi:hypothetical protein